jgi:DnaJ-class molecular chaperone
LRVRNEGDAGPRSGPPGDLYVFLNVRDHPKFKRQGRDIYSDVGVNYLDAILGSDQVNVETIDGSVTMKGRDSTTLLYYTGIEYAGCCIIGCKVRSN